MIPPFKQPEAALDLLLTVTSASSLTVDAGRLERLGPACAIAARTMSVGTP